MPPFELRLGYRWELLTSYTDRLVLCRPLSSGEGVVNLRHAITSAEIHGGALIPSNSTPRRSGTLHPAELDYGSYRYRRHVIAHARTYSHIGTQQEATRIYRNTVCGTRESWGDTDRQHRRSRTLGETGGTRTRYMVLGTDGAGTRGTITIILERDTEEG